MNQRDEKARTDDEQIEDLDASERESEDVKGGALNAYFSSVVGEKQGGMKWYSVGKG